MSIGHDTTHHHRRRDMRPHRFLRSDRGHAPGRHGPHGPRGLFGRRGQARRGVLREAVLTLLAEQPMHGYQVMQELEARSGGRWRPSAGSIYPTLQQLADEGLVQADEIEGRRTFTLTEAGRGAAAALPKDRPWTGGRERSDDLRGLSRELGIAALQVSRVGSPAAVANATRLLVEARRDLYRLLAEDAPTQDAPTQDAPTEDAPAEGAATEDVPQA